MAVLGLLHVGCVPGAFESEYQENSGFPGATQPRQRHETTQENASDQAPKSGLDPRLCRKTRSGFERPFFLNRFICCCRSNCRIKASAVVRPAASGCIDDRTNIACFAVFARRKNCSLSGRRRSFPTKPSLRLHRFCADRIRSLPKRGQVCLSRQDTTIVKQRNPHA